MDASFGAETWQKDFLFPYFGPQKYIKFQNNAVFFKEFCALAGFSLNSNIIYFIVWLQYRTVI